jgi:hypothetical protein
MIATEMPAAISPYSIAVAPDWSCTKRQINFFMFAPGLTLVAASTTLPPSLFFPDVCKHTGH